MKEQSWLVSYSNSAAAGPLLLFRIIEAGLSASITQKIVDISRKNRDLHAELAREKNKTQRAQEQISELKELIKSHEVSTEI